MLDLQLFLKERIINYLTERKYQKKVVEAVVKQYKLDFLPILPRVITEITEFISSDPGVRFLAVYKRVYNLLSSNNELISSREKFSKECATEDDKTLQKQLTLLKEQVEECLQNQFLDNTQVNCEEKELRNLRYSLLSQISQTTDSIVVFSEFDKK